MNLMSYLFGGDLQAANTPGPTEDFWYQPLGAGAVTSSGMRVDSDTAQMVSAWYRGRDILATVLAMLPLAVYRRLPEDGGSEPATDLGLYDVLHNKPNDWQDSFQWRHEKVCHLIDHGWGYDWIVPGPRGVVGALHPIKPWLVTPKQITHGLNRGRYIFHVRDEATGQTTPHTQDEIFYIRGAEGKGILEYARTSIGTALATETYAAKVFGSGTLTGGHIEIPGTLDPEAGRRMAQSYVTRPGEWHIPKVMEQGSKFIESRMSPEDAQMLDSRKHSIDEMARWLGMPRQMLENSDPSFGNAEQFWQSFLTVSMGGWLSRFEFAFNGQLVIDPRQVYAEFKRDAITRANFLDRANGNVLYVNAGLRSVDEIRGQEGWNKRGGKADELREPQNITGKPRAEAPAKEPDPPAKPTAAEDTSARARAIAVESSARLLRKETIAAQKAGVKFARDADAFEAWATAFYADHAALVAQTMQIEALVATFYCESQRDELIASGLSASERWTPSYLVALALDRPRLDPMLALASSLASQRTTVDVHTAPVTVTAAPVTVNQAPVTVHQAPVTIAEGAIAHHTTIEAVEPAAFTVDKTVTRTKDGIASVSEVHTPQPRKKRTT